jgi:basic amino acid/polyamine antiporter, APA family
LTEDVAPRLERTIGVAGSSLLSFNGIVGAAIFALPATLFADWGAFSPFLFLIVAIAAALVIVPFAASAAAFPESGGPATYGLAYGRFAGFQLGWLYYVARTAGFAANLNVLTDYLARWWPWAQAGIGRAILITGFCVALAAINIVGTKRAIQALGGFTVLKTLPLIAMAVGGLLLFGPPPAPSLTQYSGSIETGFLIVFYAFVGFENCVVPAGETKNPARTLPRALIATTVITAALYFVIQLGFVATFHAGAPEGSAPLIEMGFAVAGPAGAGILFLAAICSLSGNLLGNSASTPRVTFAMAARGDLPQWFAAVNRRFLTPANSIAFLATVVALLAISGSFVWLAVVSTLARMLIYPATIAALPLAPARPRITMFHWLTGAAGIAICLWGATQADAKAWLTLGMLAGSGLLLYLAASIGRTRAAA